jgi:uncharacterized protein (DUF1499 family)
MKPLSLLFLLGVFLTGCTGVRPSNLGVRDGKLAPCPSSPNCVSSQSSDKEHAVEPLRYSTTLQEAKARLETIIQGMPRTEIVTETGNYLHAEFTSLIFRFVDDVEFFLDDAAKLIHVRSASRLGKSDLGVNRKRIEAIREAWEKSK